MQHGYSGKSAFYLGLFFGFGFAIASAIVKLIPVAIAATGK